MTRKGQHLISHRGPPHFLSLPPTQDSPGQARVLPSHRRRSRPWFSTCAPHRAHQSHPVHGEACHSLPSAPLGLCHTCVPGSYSALGGPSPLLPSLGLHCVLEKGAPARSASPSGFPFSLAILIYPTSISHARSLSQQRQCGTASPRRHKWQSPSHRVRAPHRWCCGPRSAARARETPGPHPAGLALARSALPALSWRRGVASRLQGSHILLDP